MYEVIVHPTLCETVQTEPEVFTGPTPNQTVKLTEIITRRAMKLTEIIARTVPQQRKCVHLLEL